MDGGTEETVSQRQTTNKRAQERQANFFARHMFEKTWMIPILQKWNKWAEILLQLDDWQMTKWHALWRSLKTIQNLHIFVYGRRIEK